MLFNRGKFYSIYLNSKSDEPLGELETVKAGFNIFALLFSALWAIYHKVWNLLLIVLMVNVTLSIAAKFNFITIEVAQALGIIFDIWIGFEATNYREKSLANKGYNLFDVVYARDEEEAKLRFIDKYNHQQFILNSAPAKPSREKSDEFIFDDIDSNKQNSFA